MRVHVRIGRERVAEAHGRAHVLGGKEHAAAFPASVTLRIPLIRSIVGDHRVRHYFVFRQAILGPQVCDERLQRSELLGSRLLVVIADHFDADGSVGQVRAVIPHAPSGVLGYAIVFDDDPHRTVGTDDVIASTVPMYGMERRIVIAFGSMEDDVIRRGAHMALGIPLGKLCRVFDRGGAREDKSQKD